MPVCYNATMVSTRATAAARGPQFVETAVGFVAPVTGPKWAVRRMKPKHTQLLMLVLQGANVAEAARLVGYSVNRATLVFNSPLFQANYRAAIQHQLDQAANGTFGAQAIFRAEAERMATIVVNLAKNARNEQVRLNSARDILDRAGLAAPKEHRVLNVNELIDQMTADELAAYVERDEWPTRLEARRAAALGPARGPSAPIDVVASRRPE